jgi:molybdenum cofactor guanylyltransferase
MRIIGAVLAGGMSRRFGSDKAVALVAGKALLDHVVDALRPQVERCVIAGRVWPGMEMVADFPAPDFGPLGGLAGALVYAAQHNYDAVLSCGCDVLGLPDTLAASLQPAPAIVDTLPLVGLWPVSLLPVLRHWLTEPANLSVYRFADHVAARRIALDQPLRNINHPEDLSQPWLGR